MNKQDQELLELYLKDVRKKRVIIFIIIIIILFLCLIISKIYINEISQNTNTIIENDIQEENQQNATVNETINNIIAENTISQSNTEILNENVNNSTNKIEITEQNAKKEEKITDNSDDSSKKEETTSQKPANKDFLFTDGYTMENVSQVAQDYLNSSGYSGECIPLKDDEGVYYRYESCILLAQN